MTESVDSPRQAGPVGSDSTPAVDLSFTSEHDELRESVARFLAAKSPMPEVRRLMETPDGFDRDLWAQMAEQLGLQGLGIPEQYGGYGFTDVEVSIVFEEMGRALLPAPYFATVALATNAILMSGDEQAKQDFLPRIASGELIATLGTLERERTWDPESIETLATAAPDGYRLSGHKDFVLDGHIADLVLLTALTGDELSLFAVERGASGLTSTLLPTLDMTRKQARLEFADTPARLIGTAGAATECISRTFDLAAVALAAEQVGGAQRCLDMSVRYAKERFQFGRPIGSFQAIKHKCADILVGVESAKSAAYYASRVAAERSAELPLAACIAKAHCSEAFFHAAAENIQIHGGIGFTWEHDAHLYFKRSKSSELMLGSPSYHRELLARRLGLGTGDPLNAPAPGLHRKA